MNNQQEDFIEVYDEALTADFCAKIIDTFEAAGPALCRHPKRTRTGQAGSPAHEAAL